MGNKEFFIGYNNKDKYTFNMCYVSHGLDALFPQIIFLCYSVIHFFMIPLVLAYSWLHIMPSFRLVVCQIAHGVLFIYSVKYVKRESMMTVL